MKIALLVTTALVAGWTLGVAVTKNARAQVKPPAYTIAEIDVIDPEEFRGFAKRNADGVAAAGGLFLALRGRIVASEGVPPKALALIAWDNFDDAVGYFNSPTFKELIPLRDKGAKVRLYHVEGLMK